MSTSTAKQLARAYPSQTDEIAEIGIGMLGHGFMGKAHTNAYKTLAYMMWPPPLRPLLVSIAGRDQARVSAAADRYGYENGVTDWTEMVADDRIGLFDNTASNDLHAAPTIAAARAGKHILCEKPLARDAQESFELWRAVAGAGVRHMCAFNYRFVPAVRLAREMIAAGDLGEIYHFRGRYLQEWIMDPASPVGWRGQKQTAGSGAVGDLAIHVVDLARYLLGQEITDISASTRTFGRELRAQQVDVDDAMQAVVGFDGGAAGTVEVSRFCAGRKNALTWEINGSKGSISFDLERLNELEVHLNDSRPGAQAQGFRRVLVTEPYHPYSAYWWPPGHMVGWEHTFVHEIHHLLNAIATGESVRPHGADFEDGYRAAEVCDAALRSAATGLRQRIEYRSLEVPATSPETNGDRS
jgi:predicted dehydrogenase